MPVVPLPRALENGLRVLPHTRDSPLLVDDAHDPEGREVEVSCVDADRTERLLLGVEVFLEAVHDELPRLPVERGHRVVERVEEGVVPLAAHGVGVVRVNAEESDSAQIPEERVLRLEYSGWKNLSVRGTSRVVNQDFTQEIELFCSLL